MKDCGLTVSGRMPGLCVRGLLVVLTATATLPVGGQSPAPVASFQSGPLPNPVGYRPYGEYRQHGQYRSGPGARQPGARQPGCGPRPSLPRQPGSLLPGPGLGGRDSDERVHYGYDFAPQYVVYLPSAYPAPEPEPEPEPAAALPPIYIVVQAPASAPAAPSPAVAVPPPPAPEKAIRRLDPVDVEFRVEPADAKVDLDDRALDTHSEALGISRVALLPGVYVLKVTHPDFSPQRLMFGVEPETPARVEVDLRARPQDRTRISTLTAPKAGGRRAADGEPQTVSRRR